MKFQPILNFFSDLAGHSASADSVVVNRSLWSISRLYKDHPYLTLAVAVFLVGFIICLFSKYGNASEPLVKIPKWVNLPVEAYGFTFYYDVNNFQKSKTFTWVNIAQVYSPPFDEFGSNAKVLKYRFNHKEAKYRLTEEVRFSDGVEMTQQTYKQNIEEVTWYPVSDSALLSLYKYFLDFKKNG